MRNLGEKEEMADRKDYQFGAVTQQHRVTDF